MHLPKHGRVHLPPSVVQHLNVLRAKTEQTIILFNGDDNHYQAILTDIKKRAATAQINEYQQANSASPLVTHLGLVISKGDRFDRAIQQATELGVSEITPLTSEYCDVKLNAERLQKRMAHWRQIVISACEQSGRATLPILNKTSDLAQWLTAKPSTLSTRLNIVLSPYATETLHTLKQAQPEVKILSILVGPEGGLSDNELNLAEQHSYKAIKLGNRVMRTETAPTAMLALAQLLWGDF